jgi:hypothetical protein
MAGKELMVKVAAKKNSPWTRLLVPVAVIAMLGFAGTFSIFIFTLLPSNVMFALGFGSVNILRTFTSSSKKQVKALTWNMAAINNNPFGIHL